MITFNLNGHIFPEIKARKILLILLVLLTFGLSGCGGADTTDLDDTVYHSDTSAENCYLCGGGIKDLLPWCWGQNNVALISLNTFDIKSLEINRYDQITGQLIEEYAGTVCFGGGGSVDDGFSASLLEDYDRGYATGEIKFYGDETLDVEKLAGFLCQDCLDELLPGKIDRCTGVSVIDLATGKIRPLETCAVGFTLGDFYVDCDWNETDKETRRLGIVVFYCPVRYGESS